MGGHLQRLPELVVQNWGREVAAGTGIEVSHRTGVDLKGGLGVRDDGLQELLLLTPRLSLTRVAQEQLLLAWRCVVVVVESHPR